MKLVITSIGETLDAPLDSRFGRAAKFLVWEHDSGQIKAIDNAQNLNSAQGAGIQSAMNVVRIGVDAVITGHCGPKAFRVLHEAGIPVHLSCATTVQEALDEFLAGRLPAATDADVAGHWV